MVPTRTESIILTQRTISSIKPKKHFEDGLKQPLFLDSIIQVSLSREY